jgi:hypothetical protein
MALAAVWSAAAARARSTANAMREHTLSSESSRDDDSEWIITERSARGLRDIEMGLTTLSTVNLFCSIRSMPVFPYN